MNKCIIASLFLLATAIVTGCASTRPDTIADSSPPADHFTLQSGPSGQVYRIDRRTGKTSVLEGAAYREVSEQGMPQLVVGKVYRAEDGVSTFRYQGDGKLEKWGIEKYFNP